MKEMSLKHEIKHFFDAPGMHNAQTRSQAKKGTCAQREVCLLNGLVMEPGIGLINASGFGYAALKGIVLSVYEVFRAIACKKDARKKLGDYLWCTIQCLAAVPVVLASTLIKIIRGVLGAVIHPIIAAAAKDQAHGNKNDRKDGKVPTDRMKPPVIGESGTGKPNVFGKPPIVISGSGTGKHDVFGTGFENQPAVISGSSTRGDYHEPSEQVLTRSTKKKERVVISQSETLGPDAYGHPRQAIDVDGKKVVVPIETTVFFDKNAGPEGPTIITEPLPIATKEGPIVPEHILEGQLQ